MKVDLNASHQVDKSTLKAKNLEDPVGHETYHTEQPP